MAKYTVNHSCGHDQTHQLFGPHKERDRKLAWLEGTLCTECYHAEREKQNAEASAKASESNALAGLPALEGTPKQIAWAESIRKPICTALQEAERNLQLSPDVTPEVRDELTGAVALVVDEVVSKTSAKWWIDEGRDMTGFTAPVWIARQIRARGLAPTAAAQTSEEED